jgi:hypothetical protein
MAMRELKGEWTAESRTEWRAEWMTGSMTDDRGKRAESITEG